MKNQPAKVGGGGTIASPKSIFAKRSALNARIRSSALAAEGENNPKFLNAVLIHTGRVQP